MRPQQQNRRMRGRNNNNNNNSGNNNNNRGKGNPNPLARSYESNGPDVKIRGNAQQIAEKYTTLARDAQSSGDRVMAENYLQHAEHYNRIIAAYQAQLPNQNFQQNRDDFDDEDGDEQEGQGNSDQSNGDAFASGPQPSIDGSASEIALVGEFNGNGNGNGQRDQNGRDDRRESRNRNRDGRDRNRDQNGHRSGENRRDFQRRDGGDAQAVEEATTDSLPDFLTGGAVQAVETSPAQDDGVSRRTRRPRRGERPRDDDEGQPAVDLQPAIEVAVASED